MKYWLVIGIIGFIAFYYHVVGGIYKVIIEGLSQLA